MFEIVRHVLVDLNFLFCFLLVVVLHLLVLLFILERTTVQIIVNRIALGSANTCNIINISATMVYYSHFLQLK